MSIAAKVVRVEFPLAFYTKPLTGHAKFSKHVQDANVALRGFRIQYSRRDDDHNVFLQQIEAGAIEFLDDVVKFKVFFKIQDDTDAENAFGGAVEVVVIARLVD